MKAVIKTGGKQYYVAEGSLIFVEKLDGNVGDKVTFDEVLMLGEQLGNPYVKGAKVEGKVVSHGKAKKILVYKYKAKKNYRRTQGHRQPYTKVEITAVKTAAEKKATAKTEAEVEVKEKATTKAKAKA